MDYLPIQSLDIEAEKKITFDLFLNFPLNHRVVRYRKKGGALESVRLEKFIEGNVQNFWIRKEDFNAFVKYVAERLKSLIDLGESIENHQMMKLAAKSILSSTFTAKDSAMAHVLMANLGEISQLLIKSVLENIAPSRRRAFTKLVELAAHGSDFHKHPVNVTSLTAMITFGIGYSTEKILSEVAMGALLHDVGLAKLPIEISAHAHEPLVLGREARRELYRHCELGLTHLQENNIHVSEIMKAIITQHHEQYNGSGYPLGIRGGMVTEFAQIVRVADDLDRLIRQPVLDAQILRNQVTALFKQMSSEKIIEPGLASRIRKLFLDS